MQPLWRVWSWMNPCGHAEHAKIWGLAYLDEFWNRPGRHSSQTGLKYSRDICIVAERFRVSIFMYSPGSQHKMPPGVNLKGFIFPLRIAIFESHTGEHMMRCMCVLENAKAANFSCFTFQSSRGWLKYLAPLTKLCKFVTLDTFQFWRGWLKREAAWNVNAKSVTFETSQCPTG